MPINSKDYIFTTHLRERFVQRTDSQFEHMQHCMIEKCSICNELKDKIRRKLDTHTKRKEINEKIAERINQSQQDRSCFNNTDYMDWYYTKYGFDKRFEFLIHNELLFIVVEDTKGKVIVTCVSSKNHIAGKSYHSKSRFNKIPKKKDRLNKS